MVTDLVSDVADACVPANRWIATLTNGMQVYDDMIPGVPAAWWRLKEYLRETGFGITTLRLEAYGKFLQIDNQSVYFTSKQAMRVMDPSFGSGEVRYGIGWVENGRLKIHWIASDGCISCEIRDLDPSAPGVIALCDWKNVLAPT